MLKFSLVRYFDSVRYTHFLWKCFSMFNAYENRHRFLILTIHLFGNLFFYNHQFLSQNVSKSFPYSSSPEPPSPFQRNMKKHHFVKKKPNLFKWRITSFWTEGDSIAVGFFKHFAKHNIACRWYYYENVDCDIKYEIVNSQDKEMKTISNSKSTRSQMTCSWNKMHCEPLLNQPR